MEQPLGYVSLECLSIKLKLPMRFLDQMAKRNSIPFIGTGKYSIEENNSIGGRRYFDVYEVKKSLNKIAEWQRGRRAGEEV